MKNKIYVLMFILICNLTNLLLCGCQNSPGNVLDTSGIYERTDYDIDGNNEYYDSERNMRVIYSTDGNVKIQFLTDELNTPTQASRIEVKPHYLTEKEIQQVASLLFGDVHFYNARMSSNVEYSKNEILERINRWSQFTNKDSILDLYGENNERLIEKIKNRIELYNKMYELAPEEETRKLTDWCYKKESFFYNQETDNVQDLASENDTIMLEIESDQVQYIFHAAKRDQWDYKLNNISVYLNPKGSPSQLDSRIFQSMLCRTDRPGDKEIHTIKEYTEKLLDQMNFGSWEIDRCYVVEQYYGNTPEYIIRISAVPVLEDTPALRHPQLQNLKSDDVYASNYYLTDVYFEFSANGDLVSFRLSSPIDITNIENTEVMGKDVILDRASELLRLVDVHTYDTMGIVDNIQEQAACVINITEMDYGLTRIKVPDVDDRYYYIPSVAFNGDVIYYGTESGDIYFESDNTVPLLTINAIDGKVIEIE